MGMQAQFASLQALVSFLDPELFAFLGELLFAADPKVFYSCPVEKRNAQSMFFVYRWLLVVFKRELPLDDLCRLWEVCIVASTNMSGFPHQT